MNLLVAITGGSGSGKSTLAEGLAALLPPGAATLVSEDWYYHDCSVFPGFDAETFDFDALDIRDHDLLGRHLQALKAGRAVEAPVYDFATHSRKTDETRRIEPAAVMIVEGMDLLCPEPLAALFDLRIYLETPDDIRFIRRLLRDQECRGRTARSVIDQYLRCVRPNHVRVAKAGQERADVVVRDTTTTVDRPDPKAIAALARPLMDLPVFAGFKQR